MESKNKTEEWIQQNGNQLTDKENKPVVNNEEKEGEG